MRKKDMRKRLALFYKWGNEPVELIKFFRGEIDAAAGGRTEFQRGIMGMFGAVEKEIMGTGAQFWALITDIGRLFEEGAYFRSKAFAGKRTAFAAAFGAEGLTLCASA